MMKAILMWVLVGLVLVGNVLACHDQYELDEEVVIYDVIEKAGNGSDCFIDVYNSSGLATSGWMVKNSMDYSFNASRLPAGTYSASILCNLSSNDFLGECKFVVKEDSKVLVAIIALIPLVFGIFLIVGAATLSEEHKALRIFLFLLSIMTFFVSMHFGMLGVVKFYDFPELENLIGTTTYWTVWVMVVIVTYFIIYLLYHMISHIAGKKEAKLRY
jgi:hypothetical protein